MERFINILVIDSDPKIRNGLKEILTGGGNNILLTDSIDKALAIIERYKGNEKAVSQGRLFPKISNQKLNSYLKEIADVCGIKKNITFHIARHTFATTVTLSNGMPIETVSKLLGHSKISTTQIYAKVIERKVSDDMQRLRTHFNQLESEPTSKTHHNV